MAGARLLVCLAVARTDQATLAARLRELHRGGDPLVLVNAWDAASAKVIQDCGFSAVATTSGGVARSLGFEDEEQTPPEEMLAAVARIAAAVTIPVTADMESGYGMEPEELAARLIETGAVGLNYEDSRHGGSDALYDPAEQADRIARLKQAARAGGVDLVVNARTDVFLRETGEPDARLHEALRRAAAYRQAGADCVFPIWVRDEETILALVQGIEGPVNILARPGSPTVTRLGELGVARVSLGSGPTGVALAAFRRLAEEVRDRGTFGSS
jgi:2-methylisocitrate lyase-like PEP mutase family enzyme